MARILLIEDNDVLNKAYELVLTHNGHMVATAYDGNEGLALAETFDPELILLDMLMPNLDGLGFLKSYDATHKHPSVKVVIMSNLSDDMRIEQAMTLGAGQLCLKAELDPNQLIKVVNKQLTGKVH